MKQVKDEIKTVGLVVMAMAVTIYVLAMVLKSVLPVKTASMAQQVADADCLPVAQLYGIIERIDSAVVTPPQIPATQNLFAYHYKYGGTFQCTVMNDAMVISRKYASITGQELPVGTEVFD